MLNRIPSQRHSHDVENRVQRRLRGLGLLGLGVHGREDLSRLRANDVAGDACLLVGRHGAGFTRESIGEAPAVGGNIEGYATVRRAEGILLRTRKRADGQPSPWDRVPRWGWKKGVEEVSLSTGNENAICGAGSS